MPGRLPPGLTPPHRPAIQSRAPGSPPPGPTTSATGRGPKPASGRPPARDAAPPGATPSGSEPPPEPAFSGPTPRCLVLGAGGFIGLNLCRALRDRGIDVTGFGRAPSPPAALAGLPWRSGDIDALADPDALVAGHSHVFDLIAAGLPGTADENPAHVLATPMISRIRLLTACRRQGVDRIVFASSGGTVYGTTDAVPISEDAPTDPISAYGIGKLAVEKYLRLYQHRHGLDYRILRIGNAYGPYQDPLRGQGLVAAVLFRLMRDEPLEVWGDGRTVRDYIHIDDVVSAMLAASFSNDPATRLCNVGSGVGRDVRSVIADAALVLGRTPRLCYRPGRSGDVRCNVLDASRLSNATGWMPRVAWPDGLAATAQVLATLHATRAPARQPVPAFDPSGADQG